jgi:hypothetical protein
MPDVREQEASTGRDISTGQFKPKGPRGGSILALMVGPKSTDEGLLWDILGRVAPTVAPILQQAVRYGQASVRSVRRSEGDGSAEGYSANAADDPGGSSGWGP